MMSIPKALALATAANLTVSSVKKIKLAGRFSSKFQGSQAVRHEVKVGDAVCFYESDDGGAAAWKVDFNGATVRAGYQGEAIAKAVRLQA